MQELKYIFKDLRHKMLPHLSQTDSFSEDSDVTFTLQFNLWL